jgi:hypothetical protein
MANLERGVIFKVVLLMQLLLICKAFVTKCDKRLTDLVFFARILLEVYNIMGWWKRKEEKIVDVPLD